MQMEIVSSRMVFIQLTTWGTVGLKKRHVWRLLGFFFYFGFVILGNWAAGGCSVLISSGRAVSLLDRCNRIRAGNRKLINAIETMKSRKCNRKEEYKGA